MLILRAQAAALAELKASQAKLEQQLQGEDGAKQEAMDQNANLGRDLEAAQASLVKMETELESVQAQQSQRQENIASLNAQIDSLTAQLRDDDATIDRQTDLLAHDRDIRELMGARDLLVAEVYDVGQTAVTNRPFGRVFYTKDKSLVFYAYDLDKQAGVRQASTFQAWGRVGQSKAVNLGIFYEDNAAKKRWVLKCDNAKDLSQIDLVFVTVEPQGGSASPSGKPLLSAYLLLDPNHP